MINYQVFGLVGWLQMLEQERRVTAGKIQVLLALNDMPPVEQQQVPQYEYTITPQDHDRFEGLLKYGDQLCRQLNLTGTENRIVRFRQSMRSNPYAPGIANQQINTLYEAFQDDIRYKYFYFYPDDKAKRLLQVESDWVAAFTAFPSIKEDAKSAVDCYALGHNNASVFSCCMVLEKGLKSLAANVGLTFDVQQWKTILDQIQAAIHDMRAHGIPGLDKGAKDARLQFLSEAATDFLHFKDAWRNYVAHGHARYHDYQALGVLDHTRAFMAHLASQLSEVP